jgi:hypothetical protein
MEKPETSNKKVDFKTQFEQEQKNLTEIAVAFDVDDFTQGADDIQTVYVPDIGNDGKGRVIRYKRMNAGDGKLLEPYARESKFNQGLRTLALMMYKADGKTTFEKLKLIPVNDAAAIVQTILGAKKNFQPQTSGVVAKTEH